MFWFHSGSFFFIAKELEKKVWWNQAGKTTWQANNIDNRWFSSVVPGSRRIKESITGRNAAEIVELRHFLCKLCIVREFRSSLHFVSWNMSVKVWCGFPIESLWTMIFFSSFLTRPKFPAAVLAAAGSLLRRGIAVSRVLGGRVLLLLLFRAAEKPEERGNSGRNPSAAYALPPLPYCCTLKQKCGPDHPIRQTTRIASLTLQGSRYGSSHPGPRIGFQGSKTPLFTCRKHQ